MPRLLAVLSVMFLLSPSARAENWPQWRGPRRDSISAETNAPVKWSRTENVKWRLPLESMSGSTPIVWNDRIFLTHGEGTDLYVLGISTGGEVLWKTKVGTGNTPSRPGEGDSGGPSPSTDGRHVWALFGTGQLACLTVDGEIVWNFNVEERYGKLDISFGLTSTPVLHEDGLYLQLIHGALYADYIVGKVVRLNKLTGEQVWAVDRVSPVIVENKHSYASPTLYDHGGHTFLVTHGAECTVGHSLSDGAELWRLGQLNGGTELNQSAFDQTLRFVSSPTPADGYLIIPTAKLGPMLRVNVTDRLRGAVTKENGIAWVNRKTPDVTCAVVHDGLVYVSHASGPLECIDVETGEQVYLERTRAADVRSSPILADGKLYICAKDGFTTVVQTGREFKVLASNDLGEPIAASPVIANGVLYLRTFGGVYAVGKE